MSQVAFEMGYGSSAGPRMPASLPPGRSAVEDQPGGPTAHAALSQALLQPMVARAAEAAQGRDASDGLLDAGRIGIGMGGLFLLAMIGAGAISLFKPEPPAVPPSAVEPAAAPAPAPAASSSGLFQPVAATEMDHAVSALIMTDPQKEQVRQAVKKNALKLAWIHLSDSEVEDGDWVRIAAGGFSQNVRLFKNPLRVAVPYVPGTPIAVTGLIDGDGGGITVAVHSRASIFGLKPLVKGETVQVPSP